MIASFRAKHEAALEKFERNVKSSNYERAIISAEANEMIMTLLAEIREVYSDFEIVLSPSERNSKVGAKVKNAGYIESCLASAQMNHEFLPSYLSISKFGLLVDDFRNKRLIHMLVKQFEREISDSLLDASDKAYAAASIYYSELKTAAKKNVPGAQAALDLLRNFFAKSKPDTSSSEPSIKQAERDARALLHGTKDGKIIIENESPKIIGGKRKIIDDIHTERLDAKETLNIEETE